MIRDYLHNKFVVDPPNFSTNNGAKGIKRAGGRKENTGIKPVF